MSYFFVRLPRCASTSMKYTLGLGLDHTTAETFVAEHGRDEWDSRFTFSVIRNPWDRMVSWYFHANHVKRKHPGRTCPEADYGTFADWAVAGFPHHWSHREEDPLVQLPWLTVNGEVAMTFVGRFESLQADWATISSALGVEKKLLHMDATKHGAYKDEYTPEAIEAVAERCKLDVEAFGYEF